MSLLVVWHVQACRKWKRCHMKQPDIQKPLSVPALNRKCLSSFGFSVAVSLGFESQHSAFDSADDCFLFLPHTQMLLQSWPVDLFSPPNHVLDFGCMASAQRLPSFSFPVAGVIDSSPQIEDSVTPCKLLHVPHLQLKGGGGGVCVLCASNRGERIMGKQRASLPLSMLRFISHLPPELLGKDGEDGVTRWTGSGL